MIEEELSLGFLCVSYLQLAREFRERTENEKSGRRWWEKPHIGVDSRLRFGAYDTLFDYFYKNDHEEFFEFTRMTPAQFNKLHGMLKESLKKQIVVRMPLSTRLRLALTLFCFAHGCDASVTAWFFRIGKSTVYSIIAEVSAAIWEVLSPIYLKMKTREEWLEIAEDYVSIWNIPHCLGALDGKHIRIVKPPRSGSTFFNYKKFFSIVLMAACDAHYRFTFVDIGDFGSLNDSSVFSNSDFGQMLKKNELPLPRVKRLPKSEKSTEYFFLVDEGLPNGVHTVRPFSRRNILSDRETIFNYRHCRGRITIENTFGIVTARFKILQGAMNFKLSTTESIVQALTCLHNFLITEELELAREDRRYLAPDFADFIDESGNLIPGNWREQIVQDEVEESLLDSAEILNALSQRENLADYFLSPEGAVSWQWAHLRKH